MRFIFYTILMLAAVAFCQIDLVKQQAEINSAKADLENARQARDEAVAKRWQEKAKQNEEREKLEQQLEARKEKTETILSERTRLFEELRIAREALSFANEDAEKARISFTSVFPSQDRIQELEAANKGTSAFAMPEISIAKDSPLQVAEILFSLAKKNIEYTEEIEKGDSLIRLGGLGFVARPAADTVQPSLVQVDPFLDSRIAAELANKEDKTLREKFDKWMQDGGILMYPILSMLAIALLLIAERILILLLSRRYLKQITATIANQDLKTRDEVEKAVEALFTKIVPNLEARLPVIAVLGTTAPLVGLLGTVMGMVELFDVITIHGTADPKLLAGGISIALVTTEAGLSVAIPVHLLHTWISGRIEKRISKMDYRAMTLINERFKT
ncbi:MAG: MotA/TolQ/ExbB proton channel family protein [Fibromonadales bacterium]|nr:MotA/TolQ/ExbB proton channel family protein [Fibromonadales bacterium]